MLFIRSLIFVVLFYVWSTALVICAAPLLLAPRSWLWPVVRLWARGTVGFLRVICGARLEFRGLEHLTADGVLIAAKHQCMFDTIGPLTVFADPCYVMRDSLLKIPFYGWFAVKTGMIPIDREGHAGALRRMLSISKARIAERRQIVIFPEGTRLPPGEKGQYRPGVAALYRALNVPCIPMATNSGIHWPPHGFLRRPGVIVYEFLQPTPPGLDRAGFMTDLEARLEAASIALLGL